MRCDIFSDLSVGSNAHVSASPSRAAADKARTLVGPCVVVSVKRKLLCVFEAV